MKFCQLILTASILSLTFSNGKLNYKCVDDDSKCDTTEECCGKLSVKTGESEVITEGICVNKKVKIASTPNKEGTTSAFTNACYSDGAAQTKAYMALVSFFALLVHITM